MSSKSNKMTKLWHNFLVRGDKSAVLQGHYNQDHKRYKGVHNPGAAICVVACAFAKLKNIFTWSSSTLDDILERGINLHLKTLPLNDNRCLEHLRPSHIYKYFYLGNLKVTISVGMNKITSKVLYRQQLENILRRVLQAFFSVVLYYNGRTFAIFKIADGYYVFDPKEYGLEGTKWTGVAGWGQCCTFRFTHLETLSQHIIDILVPQHPIKIVIYPTSVEKIVVVDTKPPENIDGKAPPPVVEKPKKIPPPPEPAVVEIHAKLPPPVKPHIKSVTNFIEIAEGTTGILRASTYQQQPEHAFSNALSTFAALRLYKSKSWKSKLLDEIMKYGQTLFEEVQDLQHDVQINKMTFGGKDFVPCIQNLRVIGKLQSTEPDILDLYQSLDSCLKEHDCCVIHEPLEVAVWVEDSLFYMFDPNARDGKGRSLKGDAQGVACVTWFSNLKDLVNLYQANLPLEKSKDMFSITKVSIEDYTGIPDDWNNFYAIFQGIWILRGTFSQTDRKFAVEEEYHPTQCTAIAMMSLVYSFMMPEDQWDASTIDKIVTSGDDLYKQTIASLQEKGKLHNYLLMVSEVLRRYDMEDKIAEFEIADCLINGIINKGHTLRKGLEEFFQTNKEGVVTANSQSMAVWKRDDAFFYFDSHNRDENGLACGLGTACAIRILSIDHLEKILTSNLGASTTNMYNISRVTVSLVEKSEEGVVKPPLFFYTPINDNVSILRSNYNQGDTKKYGIFAGKQTLSMCTAALCFNYVYAASQWSSEYLDQVLKLGNELCYNNLQKNTLDERSKQQIPNQNLTLETLSREVMVGINENVFNYDVIARGTIKDDLKTVFEELFARPINEFDSVLVTPRLTVCLWRDENLIYLFDPRGRDETGGCYGREEYDKDSIVVEPEEVPPEDDEEAGGDGDKEVIPKPAVELEEQVKEVTELEGEQQEEAAIEPHYSNPAFKVQEVEEGKACILRFATLGDLLNHFYENSSRGNDFMLSRICLEKTETRIPDVDLDEPNHWFVFREFEKNCWILRATTNLHNSIFPEINRGKQTGSSCILALIMTHVFDIRRFTPLTVDAILTYGDRLFSHRLRVLAKENSRDATGTYTSEELETLLNGRQVDLMMFPGEICVADVRTHIELIKEVIVGDITAKEGDSVPNLHDGLVDFFRENSAGVIRCKEQLVSVWFDDGFYFMFDPARRGPSGLQSPHGVPCILRLLDLKVLVDIYIKNLAKFGQNFFEIINAKVSYISECVRERQLPQESPLEPMGPIGGFTPIVPGKGILRAQRGSNCEYFDRGFHLHSPSIAFSALAVSVVQKAETWTSPLIHEVMIYGTIHYQNSLGSLGIDPESSERLDIHQILADISLGSIKANCALCLINIHTGLVDAKNKNNEVINLRQGFERFFQDTSHGVLIIDKLVIGVFEQEHYIYMFDPNARGATGLPTLGGVPCLVRCLNANQAANHISSLLIGVDKTQLQFTLQPIEVIVAHQGKSRTTKNLYDHPRNKDNTCNLTQRKLLASSLRAEEKEQKRLTMEKHLGRDGFLEVKDGVWLVRGLRKMEKNLDVATNVASFIFMCMVPFDDWNQKVIEAALKCGVQIHIDSSVAYGNYIETLGLEHVMRKYVLAGKQIEIHVGRPIVGGPFLSEALPKVILMAIDSFGQGVMLRYDEKYVNVFTYEGYYYYFNAYGLDLRGTRSSNGVAALLRFRSLSEMCETIVENLRHGEVPTHENEMREFEVIPVKQLHIFN